MYIFCVLSKLTHNFITDKFILCTYPVLVIDSVLIER